MATRPKFGDIYVVRFHPAYGSEFQKYRPAVIASSRVSEADPRFALISPFTTNLSTARPETELVIHNEVLKQPSLLLSWYLLTIDANRLVKHLGSLNTQDIDRFQDALKKVLE